LHVVSLSDSELELSDEGEMGCSVMEDGHVEASGKGKGRA
jgi:hypothetical protein